MKQYEFLLFDAGDTLVEYNPNYLEIFSHFFDSISISISPSLLNEVVRLVYKIKEKTIRNKRIADLLTKDDYGIYEYILEKISALSIPQQEIVLSSETMNVLRFYEQQKLRMAIVSNHNTRFRQQLHTLNIDGFFDEIVISDEVGVAKPDPKIMQIACSRLQVNANSCIYIGDQPDDALCANLVGMDFAWLNKFHFPLDKNLKITLLLERLSDLFLYI